MLSLIKLFLPREDMICLNNRKSFFPKLGSISLGMMSRVHDGTRTFCAKKVAVDRHGCCSRLTRGSKVQGVPKCRWELAVLSQEF